MPLTENPVQVLAKSHIFIALVSRVRCLCAAPPRPSLRILWVKYIYFWCPGRGNLRISSYIFFFSKVYLDQIFGLGVQASLQEL